MPAIADPMKSEAYERERKKEEKQKEEIKSFEKKNNIELPKELTAFYTKISNGCKMLDGFNLRKLDEWNLKNSPLFPHILKK